MTDVFDGPHQVTFSPTGLVFIQLGGLQTGEIYPGMQKRVDPQSLDSRFILRRGDVLLSKTGEAPRAALVSAELSGATLSPDIYCFRVKSDLVSPAWLTYFLNSNPIREKLAKSVYGKTTARLHLPALRAILVVLPLNEIAQEIDQLEELAQQHSQAARDIWSATLRGLFTEIDDRLGFDSQDEGKVSGNFLPSFFF